MENNLQISQRAPKEKFKEFLLGIGKSSQDTFNHFGIINKKTVINIVKRELSRKDKIKFFLFFNNRLIGYSFLTKFDKPTKKHNCILGIVILDSFQNKGFGKKICKHMIKTAWKKNLSKIWLNVFYDNVNAFNLYKSLGFKIEGVFLNDEIQNKKYRHVISMAKLKNRTYDLKYRVKLCNKFKK